MSRHGNCGCNNSCGFLGGAFSNNILNLIIFVLIVLQFGKDKDDCHEHEENEIDNSILFIIALFFLFVCSCGTNNECC